MQGSQDFRGIDGLFESNMPNKTIQGLVELKYGWQFRIWDILAKLHILQISEQSVQWLPKNCPDKAD